MNIAVFASTNGTDFQAILDEKAAGKLSKVHIRCLVVNKEDCGAAEKAKMAGVPVVYIPEKNANGTKRSRQEYDRLLQAACESHQVELIVLVGWMRILSAWFVEQWPQKILNIHPSLLPKYPGMDLNVHQQVIDNKEKETGMTIHYVDEGVDSGDIILQKSVAVSESDTPESLKEKVQALEKKWYPKVIAELSQKKLKTAKTSQNYP